MITYNTTVLNKSNLIYSLITVDILDDRARQLVHIGFTYFLIFIMKALHQSFSTYLHTHTFPVDNSILWREVTAAHTGCLHILHTTQ